MEVVICADAAQAGQLAGERIADAIRDLSTPVIGVATGSSPLAVYAELAARVDRGDIDLSHGMAFALDEYVGIDPSHPQSYASTIHRTVTEPLKMDPARVHVPNGSAEDLHAGAAAYDAAIKGAGGIDVQILGIGSNGHIGFNEPASSLASRTRVKTLTAQTREDNARFFDSLDEVPTHCVTQGLGTIMESKMAVLVASGAHKADAIAAMVEGPVSAMCPASVLQFHPRVVVFLDEEAASKLTLSGYFRMVAQNRI